VTHVVVLGAGPAGLGAALRLALAGHSVTVLERGEQPGGLAASFEVGGVRVDHGSHRLHPSCAPEILAALRGLLGDDLQTRRRNGRIRLEGRFVAFPPRVGDLVRRLPPATAARLVRDGATGPLRTPRADTFGEVVRAGLGPTMLSTFYEPYVRKIWGLGPDELSGELARRRVGASSATALARRLVLPSERGRRGVFLYPRRGFGQIPEALAAAAAAAGATVRCGAEVTGVELADGGARVCVGDDELHADVVLSTIPVPALARLAGAPREVATAASGLRYRALVLVYLVLARSEYTPFDAHYFPGLDAPFSRVSEPTRYRDGRATDPPDRTVLCAEVPCSLGDDRWKADDAALGATVADALPAQGLPEATPVEVEVRRVPHAYPVYDLGFEDRFDAVDRWTSARPSLLTLGRQGLFAHDNTHHALATAWAAADAVGIDGAIDRDAWAAARERFRTHVVED
jgi:protoporphyrinogen oxidase